VSTARASAADKGGKLRFAVALDYVPPARSQSYPRVDIFFYSGLCAGTFRGGD
jgi:hypothetical protein